MAQARSRRGFDSHHFTPSLGPVAQLVERLPEEQGVVGSNPTGSARQCRRNSMVRVLACRARSWGFESPRWRQTKEDFGLVAQLVERLPEEQSVAGSIPAEFTKLMPALA